ncbi:MAG: DUF4367 domain-containing protein [Lachnospiraceae bacterium]|nr:DUF4367 domain-containing protein [Lachnospiraceae bacterium]
MRMYSADRKLLGKVLLEALSEKYDEELKQCKKYDSCSDEHLEKMSEILGFDVTRNRPVSRSRKKMWVAILIAAALLLMGCTAYVYRKEIKGFVMEIYKEYAKVNFSDVDLDNVPRTVEDKYTLGYVPEGYELVEEIADFSFVYQRFNNNAGESVIFTQSLLNKNGFGIDTERGTIETVEYDGHEILIKTAETIKVFIWNDGKYELFVEVPVSIENKEALQMIGKISH